MVMKEVSVHSGSVINTKKMTKGRQKIEMKKIQETSNRQVAFSKRRTGLFKKAAEICVLIGAQASVLVTSPSGRDRVFAFGHPDPDLGLDRNPNNNNKDYATATQICQSENELMQKYMEVSRELETEKKRAETIPVSSGGSRWYEEDVDGLDLEGYIFQLEELHKKILTSASCGLT